MSATMLFNNLITFSRGTSATLTGPTGLIQWAPMNLLTYSEQFDNAAWTKSNATVTANATASPDGTATADKLVEDTANSTHYASGSATTTAASYAFSCYIKAAERSFVLLWNSTANFGRVFDLGSGTVSGTVAGVNQATADIANVGNGWYRCTIYGTCTAASNSFRAYTMTDATTFTYTGTAGSGIYLWGAQLELGTTATTYNSTTTKNLLGYSEAFDNAAWTKSNVSIVTGAAANPINGLFNAQKLMEDTANAEHRVFVSSAIATITGVVYGYSIYAKAGERSQLRLTDNNVVGATFTLSGSGATSSVSGGVTASISPLSGGWYRCFISVAAASVNGRLVAYLVSGGATTYTGDGNSGVYIWGAQLSDSGSLDPYVPTPGAAPTSAAYYGPRFDYDPVTLAAKGLLIEEARTNLLTYSEQFDNAAWTKQEVAVTANASTAPDNTATADLIVPSVVNTQVHRLLFNTANAASAHSLSIYAKASGYSWLKLRIGLFYANFNVSTGAIGVANTGTTASITDAGNGWYRCTITCTPAANAVVFIYPMPTNNADFDPVSYAGDGTSGMFMWGVQLEVGAFATSYIPTVASTVTRSADVATMTGTNFSSWYNQSEGTFVVGADDPAVSAAANIFTVDDTTTQERIRLLTDVADPKMIVTDGNVTQANLDAGAVTANTPFVFSGAYKLNDFAAVVNGGTVVTDAAGTIPTVTTGRLGADSVGNYLNGHIRSITYYPDRLSNTQLQSLTT